MEENTNVEIDFVINMHQLKTNNDMAYVKNEILELTNFVRSFQNDCRLIITKVILETAYLNDEEIAELAKWVCHVGADFVKTSTGYGTRGMSKNDLTVIKPVLYNHVELKASGGIKTADDAINAIELGATRVGTSSTLAIFKDATAAKLKSVNLSKEEFAQMLDHTILTPAATEEEVVQAANDAIKHNFKTVCVRPEFVAKAYETTADSQVRVCVAIGFSNLANKDDGTLSFERYDISIEDKKAEIESVFEIIPVEP